MVALVLGGQGGLASLYVLAVIIDVSDHGGCVSGRGSGGW